MNGYVTGTNTDKRFKFDIDISGKFLSNLLLMVACNLESEGKFFIRQGLFITLVYLTQKPGNFL